LKFASTGELKEESGSDVGPDHNNYSNQDKEMEIVEEEEGEITSHNETKVRLLP
jgi:hypothetical protein